MSESSGKQAFSLQIGEWAIIGEGARSFFGQVASIVGDDALLGVELHPAYEYLSQTQLDPRRGIQRVRMVVPLEMLHSANRISVEPRSVIRLSDLDEADRREIESMRMKAEELRATLRAQRSGLVTPRVAMSGQMKVTP